MNFKDVPKKYRPMPFWSWNEKLETGETKRQVNEMARIGMGGFFMHARGGLQTEYMGDEWFDNVTAATEQAEEDGIQSWAYDENGWPSGFGGGAVNGLGIEYQQKYLRYEKIEEAENHTETSIVKCGDYHFYYDVNPFYVDTLDAKVIKKFIDEIYQPYYDKYKNRVTGFFTDEPQISRNGIPWSFIMPDTYQERYGDNLLERLPELFMPVGDYKQTRIRFWKMVTDLFSANYMKQIYDWCDEHGMQFTGHLVCEETFASQLASNGACMPHYEYFHIPGIDKLSRKTKDMGLLSIQMGSAAQQLGKKQTLTESFAMCGHNVSFSELRGVFEFQARNGAYIICPHLEGYSLRGIRKRDYPPAMYEQQPWWDEYSKFITAMSRVGMILSEGEVNCKTLVMHPQTMAWTVFDHNDYDTIGKMYEDFRGILDKIEEKHVQYHLGDETLMERHAKVQGDKLIIGTQTYDTVVVMLGQFFMDNTQKLLDEYKANGGRIVTPDELEDNPIIDNTGIKYTERELDGKKIYYFVNESGEPQKANIFVGDTKIDLETGEEVPFDGYYEFEKYDSLMVMGDKPGSEKQVVDSERIDLSGEWKVADCTENVITLDRCDYYFDGELQEENGYVLNIQNRACDLKRKINIKQVYKTEVKGVPNNVYLVCETPNIFKLSVNGKAVDMTDCGWFRDRAFRKLNISGMLKEGVNEIVSECDFCQSDEVYENLEKSLIFESEKNKMTYDMEIEPMYLCGDFSVYTTDSNPDVLNDEAIRVKDGFVIDKPTESVTLTDIQDQGFCFFAGKLTVEKEVELTAGKNYSIKLNRRGINAVKVSVNGSEEFVSIWNGDIVDISKFVKDGKNIIRMTLVNNLRNMLGPHHLTVGECYAVGPDSFFKEDCIWNPWNPAEAWNDDYCFVRMSVYND